MNLLFIVLLGWLTAIIINHAANVIPAKETFWQTPYYRHSRSPKPYQAWSAISAYLTRTHRNPQTDQLIGWRPVLVELGTPTLFLVIANEKSPAIYLGFLLIYTAILILLMVTDLEHRLIQNIIIGPAIMLGVLGSFVAPTFNWQLSLLGGAIGFVLFYLFALLARGGLGGGDVTLATFLGVITGFPNVILALTFGIILGGVGSTLLLITRRVTLRTFIPYGPFLIIAGWIVLIWGNRLATYFWG